jgi:hypothetical protein
MLSHRPTRGDSFDLSEEEDVNIDVLRSSSFRGKAPNATGGHMRVLSHRASSSRNIDSSSELEMKGSVLMSNSNPIRQEKVPEATSVHAVHVDDSEIPDITVSASVEENRLPNESEEQMVAGNTNPIQQHGASPILVYAVQADESISPDIVVAVQQQDPDPNSSGK